MQTGYTTTTAAKLLIGAGIVTVGGVVAGVTRGGLTLTIEKTWRNVPFDNRPSDLVGLDFLVGVVARLSGTFLQVGAAQVELYEMLASGAFAVSGVTGSALASATIGELGALTTEVLSALPLAATSGTATASPRFAGALLTSAQELSDVRLILDRGDGGLVRYVFDRAAVTAFPLTTSDRNEAEIALTIEARLAPTGTPLDVTAMPYRIEST